MKRISGKGIDVVTVVHKLVAVVWVIAALVVLVLVVQVARSSANGVGGTWARIVTFQMIAAWCSVPMLIVGLVYGLATTWGFGILRHRWLLAKWALFLAATGFGGSSISASRTHSASTAIALTAAELVVLVAAGALGMFLERSRHSHRAVRP